MYWYVIQSFPNEKKTVDSLWNISKNIVTSPIYVGGKIYGTKENPFVRNIIEGAPSRSYSTNRRRLYYGDTLNITVYDVTYSSNTQYGGYNGYGCSIFGVDTELEIPSTLISQNTRISSIDNAVISGKFRLHNIITSNCIYNSFSIPVNFSINNVTYKSFGVLDTSGIGGYFDYNKPKIASNFLVRWFNNGGTNRVIQIQTEDDIINGTYTRVNVGTTENITEDFAGSIIDFGVVEQEIPKFLFDFISANADPIYTNTFTIKSQDGAEVYTSLYEAPNMVKCFVTVVGTSKTLLLTGSNGKNYTLTWDSVTPDGTQFTGLSFSPNSKVANIPVGIETNFNLEGDVSLYECYGVYRPPITTFDINLYQNSSEPNRLDKTNYLTAIGTLEGALRDESSITDMVITFESTNVPNFNYVYIPIFNRYYFVNDITSLKYKLWQVSLSVDTLMTYKNAILSCRGFVDRNERASSPMIVDKKRVVRSGKTVSYTAIPNELFTETNGWYVLNGLALSTHGGDE